MPVSQKNAESICELLSKEGNECKDEDIWYRRRFTCAFGSRRCRSLQTRKMIYKKVFQSCVKILICMEMTTGIMLITIKDVNNNGNNEADGF